MQSCQVQNVIGINAAGRDQKEPEDPVADIGLPRAESNNSGTWSFGSAVGARQANSIGNVAQ
jgi:hypothetical protein